MSAPPYQKLFWGSYHKHTAHLGHAKEHGAYLLLIGALWNNEGRLPADDVTLAGYAKLTVKEWEAIKPKLINGTLLKIVRGKLTQPRVTEDLAKYRDTSGKRKEAGKTGGMVSAEKKRENRQAIATNLPTKPEPEPKKEIEPPVVPQGDDGGLFDLLPAETLPADTARQAFDAWNALAQRCGLPIAEDLTERREKAIKARIEKGGLPRWARALEAVEASAFCLGQARPKPGEKPFKANLDFVLQASSFQKLIEGNYGRDAKPVATPDLVVAVDPLDVWRRRVNAFRNGSGFWNTTDWEAQPGRPGCKVPPAILREFDLEPATPQGAAA